MSIKFKIFRSSWIDTKLVGYDSSGGWGGEKSSSQLTYKCARFGRIVMVNKGSAGYTCLCFV